ncbi:Rossmann-like and DUF2520 domain-containing protein [Longibacter salinarum]|uniref:Rossmann-like and DUF2520 domain-containing protein n=1 Tax=Longibacter salinarum TaxID=1850348 RepID=UPI001FEAFD99|nr:Rossmann-like and DUF2520 domain-containing protein [Longibacter salinarum]
MSSSTDRPVAIIGAGAVGTSLTHRLAACDIDIAGIISSRREPAERLASEVAAPVASTSLSDLPGTARVVFLCVPDDVIPSIAAELAEIPHPWPETIVAHTSGASPSAVLEPLASVGASVVSFHPMQTFPDRNAPEVFDDIYIGVEGEGDAVAYAEALVERLGANPMVLTPAEKTRVHAAAALASNGLAALVAVVRELLGTAGLAANDATRVVQPLIEQTWSNLKDAPPEIALTGPIVRGDIGTVKEHLAALEKSAPHLLPVYAVLAKEQVRVARRADRLTDEQSGAILDIIQAGSTEASVPQAPGMTDVSVTET